MDYGNVPSVLRFEKFLCLMYVGDDSWLTCSKSLSTIHSLELIQLKSNWTTKVFFLTSDHTVSKRKIPIGPKPRYKNPCREHIFSNFFQKLPKGIFLPAGGLFSGISFEKVLHTRIDSTDCYKTKDLRQILLNAEKQS